MTPSDRSANYQICVEGQLDERWRRWFEGLDLSLYSEGETMIRGEMDQSALFGVLNRIGDLGLELISLQRIELPGEIKGNSQ